MRRSSSALFPVVAFNKQRCITGLQNQTKLLYLKKKKKKVCKSYSGFYTVVEGEGDVFSVLNLLPDMVSM